MNQFIKATHKLIIIFLALFISSLIIKTPVYAAAVAVPTNVPSEVQINQSFTFNSEITGANPGEVYFVKCRVGPSLTSTSLTEGQTYNSNTSTWLSDSGASGAWVNMPTVEVVSGNSASFSIQCRVKSGVSPGQKYVFARACLRKSDGACGTSFQSTDGVSFTALAESTPTSTPTLTPTSSPTPSPLAGPTPTKTPTPTKIPTPTKAPTTAGQILTTLSPSPTKASTDKKATQKSQAPTPPPTNEGLVLSQSIATETPTPTPEIKTAGFFEANLGKILIIVGGIALVGASFLFIRSKREIIGGSDE